MRAGRHDSSLQLGERLNSAIASIQVDIETGFAELYPDPDVPGAFTLVVNGVPQSHVDLEDPDLIAFDYVRRMADIIDTLSPGGGISVLHLGAGAMTLPRCLTIMRPGSVHRVVELDAALLRFVLEYLPLGGDELVETVTGDAATVLACAPAASEDVVVADVFQGGAIPSSVSTLDFAAAAARVVKPGGCYVANIMDSPPLAFARAQVSQLTEVFDQVAVVADAGVLRGRRQGNLLLVGADEQASFAKVARRLAADPFAVRIEYGDRLTRWLRPRP